MAVALVACSGGGQKKRFSRSGVERPLPHCEVDPRRFARAEKIRDFDEGNGCGVRNAWRIYAINGVRLSEPAVLNCAVANTMSRWITDTMQPAAEDHFGERVSELTIASSYSCRPRNNAWGARLSEHGMGNAIDVAGFRLAGGDYVAVEQGWFGHRAEKKFLAQVRREACGPFKTVLGPGADRHHANHLHFDLQRHRSGGAYCR